VPWSAMKNCNGASGKFLKGQKTSMISVAIATPSDDVWRQLWTTWLKICSAPCHFDLRDCKAKALTLRCGCSRSLVPRRLVDARTGSGDGTGLLQSGKRRWLPEVEEPFKRRLNRRRREGRK
jgi:hypothetical protein